MNNVKIQNQLHLQSDTLNKLKTLSNISLNKKMDCKEVNIVYATGKRKSAIAKVYVSVGGSGKIIINGKSIKNYFKRTVNITTVESPLYILKIQNIYDVSCFVHGSGLSGQADAIKHGISKALNEINKTFRTLLRKEGLLTRDSRKVERKKYGQPKARKKFQFSKR
jgi:small subunit ribosomal protein S9